MYPTEQINILLGRRMQNRPSSIDQTTGSSFSKCPIFNKLCSQDTITFRSQAYSITALILMYQFLGGVGIAVEFAADRTKYDIGLF